MNMRAKMRVSNIDKYFDTAGNVTQERLTFTAVSKSTSYPTDGTDEDNTFALWTPTGTCQLSVNNPALFGQFNVDEKYYVDFTPAN